MSMTATIKTINAGSNCFLVQAEGGFVLIDTGVAYKRTAVERELQNAGCGEGDLKLVAAIALLPFIVLEAREATQKEEEN